MSEGPGVVPIRRALISVSDKSGLDALAASLAARGVELVSTGGTAAALRSAGHDVRDVADLTGAPEMMDGRVKTLHPGVHGGLLARRDAPEHMAALAEGGFAPIDLLVVNLYPFEAALADGADLETMIERIDIGGPAMIRSAAKNHASVAVVVEPSQYPSVVAALDAAGGLDAPARARLAATAFARTAAYDAVVSAWMADAVGDAAPERRVWAGRRLQSLRYGENPHQTATLYADLDPRRAAPGPATAELRQGKPLSYNNIADADAAFALVSELAALGDAACAIVKHANPCGAAVRADPAAAYRAALAADRVSAFGGVVAFGSEIDAAAADAVLEIFTEVVIAPSASEAAAARFAAKPNVRLLTTGAVAPPRSAPPQLRAVAGGFLAQDGDPGGLDVDALETPTARAPDAAERADMAFAWAVAGHVKSNAIVFAKDARIVGVGAGQMSRVDSTRLAAAKARAMADAEIGTDAPSMAVGAVAASDAFFPFADGIEALAAAGVRAVVQPGGSVRDAEVIAAADAAGLAMAFTGVRRFRH